MHELRRKVLAEAETWIGTPHENGQMCKGAGVDCGQLLKGVFYSLGLVPDFAIPYYAKDFHLHRDEEWYIELVEKFSDEIPGPPEPADLVLFKQGRLYSHGAIVTDWPWVIHTYGGHGVIRFNTTNGRLAFAPRKFFRPRAFA